MHQIIRIEDRSFKVIRVARESLMTGEIQESIKNGNPLIDIVIRDGKGGLLFCHEIKSVDFREIIKPNNIEERDDKHESIQPEVPN